MDAKIVEYRVISEQGIEALMSKVNAAIRNGWQVYGGVCSHNYIVNKDTFQSANIYSQALVKYESSKN